MTVLTWLPKPVPPVSCLSEQVTRAPNPGFTLNSSLSLTLPFNRKGNPVGLPPLCRPPAYITTALVRATTVSPLNNSNSPLTISGL